MPRDNPLETPHECVSLHWMNVDHCHLPAVGERVLVRTSLGEFYKAWMGKDGFEDAEGTLMRDVTHYAYVHGPDNQRLARV